MLKKTLESRGRKVKIFNVRGLLYALMLPWVVIFMSLFYDDVICHRSYYDFLYRCLPERTARSIMFLFPPIFNYKFFLYADEKVIHARKKEWPEKVLRKRQDVYRKVSYNHGFTGITTEISEKESLEQMLGTMGLKSKN